MSDSINKRLNRRNFLKLAGTMSVAGVVVSCAPAVTQTPANDAEPVADAPKQEAPPPQAVTIRYGRHDAIDGDVENVIQFSEQFPHINVEQEQIGDFAEKVPAMAAAGNLPDVLRSWEAMVLDLGRVGQVIDIQPMVDAAPEFKAEDFYENWWNYPLVEGKRLGVPDVIAPHATLYNAQLFEDKGVEPPDLDNFTWADFEEKARALSDPENQTWGSEAIPVGWVYFTLKQVWQNGGDFFTPDYAQCVIDKEEVIEAVQYWADLLLDGNVMPTPSQIADIGGLNVEAQLLAAGKIGMQRMGVWIINDLMNAGFKWNIVPEPTMKRKDTITHGAFNAITQSSAYKDEAWTWLNFHSGTQGIYNYSLVGKFPGARKTANQMTPHPWIVETDFEVNWDVIPQCLEYGHVLPGPANEGEALKHIGDALQLVYNGTAKAAEILPEVAPKVTEILQQEY